MNITFNCHSKGGDLTLSVELDGAQCYHQVQTSDVSVVSIPFENHHGDHLLRITMSGKLPEHTQLAANDKDIVSDRLIQIDNFCFDGTDVTPYLYKFSSYYHDFNGTADPVQDKFYGSMGCNGDLLINFSTPVYPWILENAR